MNEGTRFGTTMHLPKVVQDSDACDPDHGRQDKAGGPAAVAVLLKACLHVVFLSAPRRLSATSIWLLKHFCLCFQGAWRHRSLGSPPDAALGPPLLRPATTLVFWRLQTFALLPIVMPWHAMMTTSVSGPEGSGIASTRGSTGAVPRAGAAVRPPSTGKFNRLFDGPAAIPPGWARPGRAAAGSTSGGEVPRWLRR